MTYRVHRFTIRCEPQIVLVHRSGQRWPAQAYRAVHTTGLVVYVVDYIPRDWRTRLFGPRHQWLVFNSKLHLMAADAGLERALIESERKL